MESISEIKNILNNLSPDALNDFAAKYSSDPRAGVKKIVETALKRKADFDKELKRLDEMLYFENKYSDYEFICGIDEAGRGPLAGPVVAAAVILPKNEKILYVNDSKKLSPEMRERLYDEITKKALSYGVGIVSHTEIDKINILQATYEAMKKAVSKLKPEPTLLLNDAVRIPGIDIRQVNIIKGDAKSLSIAAASIIAKVTRDRIMIDLADKYPEYNFKSNKGYGSKEHIDAIKKYGPCEIHRRSFIQGFI